MKINANPAQIQLKIVRCSTYSMYGQNDSNQLKAAFIPSTLQCVFKHPNYIVHRPKMTSITKDSKAKVEAKSFAKATFLGSFKNLGSGRWFGMFLA